MLKAVVCLGNPGKQYENSRHNLGRRVCREFRGAYLPESSWSEKFHSQYTTYAAPSGEKFIIQQPLTYMNRSGMSVRELAAFFKLQASSIVVVHDDLESPFGTITVKHGGGHGGHNGVRSIIQELGDPAFYRLKIGIGRPETKQSVSSFVLSRFSPLEESRLPEIVTAAAKLIAEHLQQANPQEHRLKLF
ncbi:MAG: aminoacyl-tRNA hydrolase [Spirochaetota bacterium]